MNANLAAVLYLVAGVLFILALRGLSNPASSRLGNLFGMVGMAIAIVTTLAAHPPAGLGAWALVVLGMTLGGGIGAVIARRVPMTSMPELVAAFHSLVGMAAVVVAAGALYAPSAFDIGAVGAIHGASLVEMSLGVAIGAITFTGSVIAFSKLSGRMSGASIILPARHAINIGLAVLLVGLIAYFVNTESHLAFWALRYLDGVRYRRAPHHPDRRRRHAGRDLDAQFLLRLGGGRHRLHAGKFRLIITGCWSALRRDPVLHHVQGHEPQLHPVILGGFGGEVVGPIAGAEQRPRSRVRRRRRLHREERRAR